MAGCPESEVTLGHAVFKVQDLVFGYSPEAILVAVQRTGDSISVDFDA